MGRIWKGVSLTIALLLFLGSIGRAQSNEELLQRIEAMQRQMDEQQAEIDRLRASVGEAPAPDEATEDQIRKLIDDRLAERKKQQEGDSGFLSLKNEWLEIGGGIELEFIDYEDEDDVDLPDDIHNPESSLAFDKVWLDVQPTLNDWFKARMVLEWDETDDRVKVDKAYGHFHWDDVICKPNVKIGINSVPYKPSRRTERYPIIGTAVYRDEELAIDYSGSYKIEQLDGLTPYWGFTIGNMRRIEDADTGERATGLDDVFQLDRGGAFNLERTDHKFYRGRVGLKHDFGDFGKVDVLGYMEDGQGDGDDFAYWLGNGAVFRGTQDREFDHFGFRGLHDLPTNLLGWQKGALHIQGFWANVEFGPIEAEGWYFQLSHEWKPGWEYLEAFEVGGRLGEFDIWDHAAGDPFPIVNREETWDRDEYTFFLLIKMDKHLKWKFEYTTETADGGQQHANLDYFSTLLEIKF